MSKKERSKPIKIIIKIIQILLIIICIIAVILGIPLITMNVSNGKEPNRKNNTNPYIMEDGSLVSAHRSGGEIAPENTMMAFENCIEAADFNVDVFEFDLHITKDGELILLHDGTLDRTSDAVEHFGEKKVKPETKTLKELRELNFGENFETLDGKTPFKGKRGKDIPEDLKAVTLEEVLDYLQKNGDYHYIIEIKDKGENGKKAADSLYSILKERDLLDQVIFGTFHGDVTKYVDEHYPDMMRSASILEVAQMYFACGYGFNINKDNLKYVALQVPANQFYLAQCGHKRFVNYAHCRNIAVQYWTINDPKDIEKLNNIGADCIMSDNPALAYKIINKTA